MKRRALISAYTPSNTDPALLARIFVQRERLLKQIVARLKKSMSSHDKHHILLVGPRGSGKTNMVTLALSQLSQMPDLNDSMRIAWLGEDDIFSGLIHLAFAIAKSLANEYPKEFPEDFKSAVRGLTPDDAALAVLNNVIKFLQHRHLLLVTENLDQTFNALGDLGQKKLRAFLQETRRIASLATTQQLFDGVAKRDEAFFGFFDTHHLEPLSVDDARQLIRKIAEEQGNHELLKFLDTSSAHYRIRALHHLAGGNHRMYVLLSEFLTRESLDDLIAAFEILADEMTPYFQERMRALPDQQRQLAQNLCNASGALTVKQLSEETFIAEGNCSKQLGNLKSKGYVRSEKRGKESYYDMCEPLMRLCLEIKNQRGKPLNLVARFLRAWFPESKLQMAMLQTTDKRSKEYCQLALFSEQSYEHTLTEQLKREIDTAIGGNNFSSARVLVTELREVNPQYALTAINQIEAREAVATSMRAIASYEQGNVGAALTDYNAVIETHNIPPQLKATAFFNRAVIYRQIGNSQSALLDYTAVIEMQDLPLEIKAKALSNRGLIHREIQNFSAALADYGAVIQMPEKLKDQKSVALLNRGAANRLLGDLASELADYTAVIQMPEIPPIRKAKALLARGFTYAEIGDLHAAKADYTALVEMGEAPIELKADAKINRAIVNGQMGDLKLELADYTTVIEMPEELAEHKATALVNRAITHSQMGNIYFALSDYSTAIEMPSAPIEQIVKAYENRAVINWQIKHWENSVCDFNAVLKYSEAHAEHRTRALFSLPEPMVAIHPKQDVAQALQRAFIEGDRSVEAYGGTPVDLLATILKYGPNDWQAYVHAIAPLYFEYGAVDKLGHGITQSIRVLDEGGYSHAQLDQWYVAWQNVASGREELEIPLACLSAAVEVMKSNPASDRALFNLPLEIRQLMRPLLHSKLGTE